MKTKRFLTLLTVALGSLTLSAQGVEFMPEGSSFKDALAKAKAENKDVLLDCYTSWCGPCRMMANNVFPKKEMGDYINPKFVSIKIDMEKGEGPEIARRNDVSAYPTFIIFDADGKEKGRLIGGTSSERFLAQLESTLSGPAAGAMDQRYDQGERDPEFLLAYIGELEKNYRKKRQAEVVGVLLESRAEDFASDSTLVKLFMNNLNDPYNAAFVYSMNNPEAINRAVGEKNFKAKINDVFSKAANATLRRNSSGGADLDTVALDKLCDYAASCGLSPAVYRNTALISYSQYNKDWNGFANHIKDYMTDNSSRVSDGVLAGWAKRLLMGTTDTGARLTMKAIVDNRLDEIKNGTRKIQKSKADPDGSATLKNLQDLSADLANPAS